MKSVLAATVALAGLALTAGAWATPGTAGQPPTAAAGGLPMEQPSVTKGSVTVEGRKIDYTATAGTIILKDQEGRPTGSMFYVAYVKRGVKDESQRPVTFFHNGGPGSSTIWLHMGAFGPQRITTTDLGPTPAAPYQLVNNDYSLLDVTDEVFIDAMNTGYSRIIGKDQGGVGTTKDFYGTDPDMKSFAQFIKRYATENHRWNSPKYLYGESYGTLRNEVLVNYLEQAENMDVNGIVLQSAYMGSAIPYGSDIQYEVVLPSMAATAWYHRKVPNAPADMQAFLAEVEHFAMNEYAVALNAGNALSPADFDAIAEKVHGYTGLPVDYIK
jgi:carboxypeptidase C (cathepsin A)